MIKSYKNYVLIFSLFLLHSAEGLFAQSIQRESISSFGSSMVIDQSLIRQTIGQPFSTQTFYSSDISFRPGFQQPLIQIHVVRSDFSIKTFPNPTANFINIESATPIHNATLTIIDNIGKLVLVQNVPALMLHQIDCSDYANGMYILNVRVPEKTFTAKIIINK
jgi:hypothetical protein